MAGKKNRDRTEKTVCRENGKAMEMVIETESAQEEKQQIPGNESANADKKKQEEREAELPEAFLKRMKELLGEEFPAFLESYEAERVQGLRWNPLKGEPSSLSLRYGKRFGLSPVSWCAEGNYYDQKTRPGKHVLHEAGIYYIQEPKRYGSYGASGSAARRTDFGSVRGARGKDHPHCRTYEKSRSSGEQ